MSLIKQEYFLIFLFFELCLVLAIIILIASSVLAIQVPNTEKLSPYECGFDPFGDTRHPFDVRFYLVAILFIIFDIESMYLFTWAISLAQVHSLGFWAMIDFIAELGIGYLYAWKVGALEWD